ncbi:MAG TPA: vWA domain-containing protein [Polyangiaceae bacterium]|jgi:hypothetical protein
MKARRGGIVVVACAAIAVACGARTGLYVPTAPPAPRPTFCVGASYEAGFSDLDLVFLLDRSDSMNDGNKWSSATAALASFVADPAESGLGAALVFFPPVAGDPCASDGYAMPAVPMQILPAGASKITGALGGAAPAIGTTPLAEALRGVVEYARGQRLADPTREVAVAVITDGAPEGCAEPGSAQAVAAVESVAAEAFTDEPSVMTYVIGLSIGYVDPMNAMAAAGGTQQAILIDGSPNAAQNIVNALSEARDAASKCRFPIPPVSGVQVQPSDLSVTYQTSSSEPIVPVALEDGLDACGSSDGFVVDDPSAPTRVQLCPATCAKVHTKTTSKVVVTAGCGEGAPEGGAHGDGGVCPSQAVVTCVSSCVSPTYVQPVCTFGEWTCPDGSRDKLSCDCPAVPHGCCIGDGTWTDASCVNAKWTCPPGASFFGEAGCAPPAACAPLLPCAPGSFCSAPDFSCGTSNALGACTTEPASCTTGDPVCGCDDQLHASACDAASQGVDLGDAANCSAPSGTFGCGPYFCRSADQVCKKTIDLVKTVAATSWACVPASKCSNSCSCNQCQPCPAGHSKCNEACSTDSTGDRFVTCSELP